MGRSERGRSSFLFLSQRFATPLAEVSNVVDQYENALTSAERVFGLMDVPVGVTDDNDAVVRRAATAAGADEFGRDLPNGTVRFDT